MKNVLHWGLVRPWLRSLLVLALLMMGVSGVWGQTNYVFYNGTYGYLYNDNGTLKSSTSLQFDKSSVWTASGTIGTTSRTIQSYTSNQYLGNAGSLSGTSSNWRGYNSYLAYRPGNTNYYLKATNATTFTTNSNANNGERFYYYTVTINDIAQGFSGFEITGGESSFNATGSSTYSHTTASYSDQAYTHYNFNGNNYYVNSSNTSTTTAPGTTVTSASAYTWSLSDNASGYATVDNSGQVTITAIPTSGNLTITLTCTVAYDNHTATATKSITLSQTGVGGGIVTLDDREDHSWSYYSDSECPIRSLNPADVKITYYGDGIVMSNNNDYTAGTNNYVSPGDPNYVGGAKVNVGGEDENTFVYYKTLERTDGSTSDNPTGRCLYTPIPNPFQVRPTYGSRGTTDADDFIGWRGFQCWRLKSVTGGAVYSVASGGTALAVNAIVNAETQIYFAPNGEYGMEVEFEAVWARAYLKKGNSGNANAIPTQNVGVERNFMILTANENYRFNGTTGRRITNVGYPVTISCYYPSGEAPDNTSGVVTGNNNNITLGANTKFENVTLSAGSYTLTASGYDLIVGRGCTSTNVGTVRGMSDGSSSAVDYTIRLESGTYGTFALIDNTARTFSSTVSTKAVFGSDYDRAKSDNNKLSIAANNTIYGGNAVHVFSSASNRNNLTYDWLIKSGKVQGSKSVTDANADESIYIGNSGNNDNTQYMGKRRFTMEGGEIASLAGSLNSYGNNRNTYMVNDGDAVEIRVMGGTIRGSVYGAAAYASATGNRRFVFTGGDVRGWIAGGANGTQSDGGYLYGSTKIYIGGKTNVNSNSSTSVINRAVGGNVFGAGCGYGASSNSGQVTEGTTVVVADESYVERGVYGGGSYGYTTNTSNIYILGGHVGGKNGGVSGTTYSGTITGGVFGGACQNQGGTVNITMTGGLVEGGVYGGSNATGTIANSVTMNINGGQVGTSSSTANIHGGGYGNATRVSQNVEITLGTATQTTPGVTVYGDVYGGSALGYVNGTAATNTYHTYVTLNKGIINGSLYGGGLGSNSVAANVYGPVQVKVYGGSVRKTDSNGANGSGGVYGANNVNGAPQRSVTVDIYGTDPAPSANEYALFAVYGGGNAADYTYGNGYPKVTVHNCDNSIEYVYGGGNAAAVAATDVTIWGGDKIGNVFGGGNGTVTAANVNGNAVTKIYGGTIGSVFGGSNSQGTISGDIRVTVNKQDGDTDPDGSSTACDMIIGELYGGGNKAASNVGSITIGCTGTLTSDHSTHPENIGTTLEGIGYVYGGANQANITGDITLTMNSGIVGNLFGGNNTSGTVSGGIQVKVEKDNSATCASNWYVGNVFGGGNLAQYAIPSGKSLAVNILNGTVSGNVYGGGKGDPNDHTKGQVTGNPIVTIGDATKLNDNNVVAAVNGDVYGGGDAGNVVGTPQVNVINKCNTSIANVYGGGNAADVNGTDVNIDGGNITGMVFGGGHGDKNSTPQKEANVNGDVAVDVTGGTVNKVFGGSNSKGTISGTVAVNIAKGANSCEMHITEVYGGGNEAAGNAGTITIGCTGDYTNNSEGVGTVYGGANQADINNNISLTIRGGHIDNVYGGNNTSGSINGTITVNVNWDDALTCDKYLGNVFGGGNQAVYTAPSGSENYPAVNILKGTVSGDVFGGGYGNASDATKGVVNGNPQVTINGANASVLGGVYGGGSLAPTVGNPVVTLTNGSTVKVFGGGKAAGITGAPTVNINGGSVTTGVYGGCDSSGNVTGNIVVNINGGTLGTSSARLTSGIFGGGYGSSTTTGGNVTVNVGDANAASAAATSTIYGDIYGGSALGTVNDAVADVTTVNINNGTIHGNIYGGGLGAATLNSNGYIASVTTEAVVNGTVHVNIGTSTQASNFVTIDGQVFGCNNLAGSPKGHVYVDVYHTAHTAANTYPTLPANTTASDITSLASTAFAIAAVYGGGNLAHYTTDLTGASTHVHIHNCYNTIEYVYGGGNAASSPATDVIIDGGRFNYIFGGGNGAGTGNPGADIVGNAEATITGGVVYRAFGGSNTKGTIGGTSQVVLPDGTPTCDPRLVHEIFGGGNEAPGGNVDMVIPCGTTGTGIVYAGANNADMGTEADFNNGNPVLIKLTVEGGDFTQVFGGNNQGGTIWGNVELYLKGGKIANAFGGNNLGGNIKGTIKVFVVDDENPDCPLVLTNVYGGGYNAAYTPTDATIESPQVYVNHIKSGNKILGSVYGGGYGTPATVTANPVVTIGDLNTGDTKIARIAGNVYGGGEQAKVDGNTKVIMQKTNSVVEGTIYGAGKGVATNPEAALVTKNTLVTMTGGQVQRSIYGGGELSSVGTFTEKYTSEESHPYHAVNEPKACADNTGLTEVLISGGRVGLVNQLMPDPSRPTSDDDYGYVFCAGKGVADSTSTNGYPMAHLLAVSGSSHLEISGTALIAASAYGGSENGQVLGDTHVEIKGGQIGSGHYEDGSGHHWDPVYTESQWTTAINAIKSGVVADINSAAEVFHECDAWPFGAEGNRHVYDYYHGTAGYNSQGGGKPGSDGHSYYGHVFGGGSGYYPFAPGKWRRTAGRVNGNTLVEITGGHILTNVYGGNEITDVLGHSKVVMKAGTVGVPRTLAGIQARPVNSYIFGAGMGDPRTLFNDWSNVGSSEVIVDEDAVVFGSVFGGGEDGHVLGNSSTTIKGNALIGTFGTSGVDGNIFGSGRGFSALALTAGVICGDITVNISENAKILGSVFGGGRLAAVGTYLSREGTTNYGKLIPEGQDPYGTGTTTHGNVTINITGGTIGTQAAMSNHQFSVGDVFGGSKGTLMNDWAKSQKLGLVKNTTVNISQVDANKPTTIYGNVYGGGEIASVGSYIYADATAVSSYNSTHTTEPLTVGDVYRLDEANTGKATILITGGTIGHSVASDPHGHVFGGCLGRAGTDYSGYSFVNESVVTLQNGTVYGSIFGGGENGHVLDDTNVNIRGGSVGIRLDNLTGTIPETTIYRGNVYGGGRGIDTYNNNGTQSYSITAGKVSGHTTVTITGGQVYRNVYGGGSLASVGDPDENSGGLASVSITGGKIGTDGGYHGGNFVHLLENGHVFGSGRGVAGGSNDDFIRLAYVKNTQVTIGGTAYVTGSVFGSGENGHVRKNTIVTVNAGTGYTHELAPTSEDIEPYPVIGYPLTQAEMVETPTSPVMIYRGNVYGGGRGIDHTTSGHLSETAGAVKGNATVNINGGTIRHNVYGGGSLASTGDITDENGVIVYHDVDGNPTGEATVNISGGLIGMSPLLDICKNGGDTYSGLNNGQVYGGARGVAAGPGQTAGSVESEYVLMAYVHDTQVNVSGTAKVFGSVFGGGANGHVSRNTVVNVSGGEIGTNPSVIGTTSNYYFMNPETGIDGHVIFTGNVYGGGRGIDRNEEGDLSATAGRVYGNTQVNITGGQIYHNVYGGGSLASVGTFTKSGTTYTWTENTGKSEVIISGGTVGFEDFSMDDYLSYMSSHPGTDPSTIFGNFTNFKFNTGRVFGSGRGMAGAEYTEYAYVRDAYVTIQGTGAVKGNVFGSGENGHVKRNTYVEIKGGEVGYKVPSLFLGNVYGGGRGVDLYNGAVSVTAGRTEGNSNVTISGGKIYRDIYGGGSLASVGQAADNSTGLATVTIESGGTIGDDFCVANGFGGNVFGSGRGMVKMATGPDYSQMAYVNRTEVVVKGHVMGNVYGGGNAGHVRNNTHVQILGGALVGTNYGGAVYYGNVFGAGKGTSKSGDYSATAGAVLGSVVVDMLGGTVLNDVYGGAALANSNIGNATNYGTASEAISATSTNTTTVNLVGGTLKNAYGGGQGDSETAAIVYGDASVLLNGSTATGATNNCVVKGNIFGCNNINGTPKGHALVHVYRTQGWTGHDVTAGKTDATIAKGTGVYEVAAVYGGGNMAAYEPVSGTNMAEVIIDGCDLTSIEYVYGGGNAASVPASQVTVNGTYEIGTIFGGGNGKDALPNGDPNPGAHVGYKAANFTPDPTKTAEENEEALNAAFEAQKSTLAYGTGNANVYLFGGTIHNAFGASNTKGVIAGKAEVHVDEKKYTSGENAGSIICPLVLNELYGGGNEAYMEGGTNIDLGCITYLKTIYGGAKKADVNGDISLTITSGHFDRVFGGNNLGGTISGTITVNIEETGCNPITIGELYGCGNQAPFGDASNPKTPTINVKSFTSIGRIFGGGLGNTAIVTGNPTVNINEVVGDHATVMTWPYHQTTKVENGQTVPDAGKTITFSDGTSVTMPTHESGKIGAIGTVFGGGNAAQVTGNTNVNVGTEATIKYTSDAASDPDRNVVGVDIRGNVFGGGNKADVTGNTEVVVGR